MTSQVGHKSFDATTIAQLGSCAGCGLCAAVAPNSVAMSINRSGFLRPAPITAAQPMGSEQQRVLAASCPGVRLAHAADTRHRHPLWGPVRDSLTGYAIDAEIRHQGSSGGALSALAWHLLKSEQVDVVAQIAASQDEPLVNVLQASRSREDVLRAAGSRYAPAAPLAGVLKLLAKGERLALVGKPCDVAALRQYLRLHPQLQAQVPYMLSFMCAGTPSVKGTHAVLAAMGTQADRLASFRYRGDGWPGLARAVQQDGQVYEMDYNASWGNILGKHLQLRCKICPDGTGEFADITCADAWYGKDGYPDFEEREGRSLILVRTAAGKALLDSALRANAVAVEALPIEEVERMQPYQVTRKRAVLGRVWALRLRLGRAPRYVRMGLLRASASMPPLQWLRQAWGTYRRSAPEAQ